jgi:hypothetical protein
VFLTYCHLYRKIDEGRAIVRPSHFFEMHYEDLIRDPVGQMQTLYAHLGLGDFEIVRPRLEQYLASIAGYETNRYDLSPEMRAEITGRWSDVIRRYGYTEPPARPSPAASPRQLAPVS